MLPNRKRVRCLSALGGTDQSSVRVLGHMTVVLTTGSFADAPTPNDSLNQSYCLSVGEMIVVNVDDETTGHLDYLNGASLARASGVTVSRRVFIVRLP